MAKYLLGINEPKDLDGLTTEELHILADEIRELIINTVSENGGHLSSNLGVVELTLALHKIFDFSKDRIIWDVGHQSYTHKILTGRKNIFQTLRKEYGISGFPKTSESIYDSFNTGHSSTSISAALGMVRARELNNEKYKVCAVLGDGALTGGMAFEGLNDAGQLDTQLLIVLNDNEMSINKNVGGLSRYLNKIASKPGYNKFKKGLKNSLNKIPRMGQKLVDYSTRIKTSIKHLLQPDVIFDDLGLKYIGPVNGHNIKEMMKAFEMANKMDRPVVVHVKTVKGMGYDHAEARPDEFHGIAPFNVPSGGLKEKSEKKSNSVYFSETLCKLAKTNKDVVAITAAMPNGTGLNIFAEEYPERFFDVGIAEQHAVTMAAGMAMAGKIPCVVIYSTFLQRAFDQLLHDVALQNLHVVFGVDRAGVVGDDGETHQGLYDISYLNMLPNFTILAPASLEEMEEMLDYAINEVRGPVAIRYPRKSLPMRLEFEGSSEVIKEGNDVTIIAAGDMVWRAVEISQELIKLDISAEIINLRVIKPLNMNLISKSINKTNRAITLENNTVIGGVGERILAELNKTGNAYNIKNIAFPDEAIAHMSVENALIKNGLGVAEVVTTIKGML